MAHHYGDKMIISTCRSGPVSLSLLELHSCQISSGNQTMQGYNYCTQDWKLTLTFIKYCDRCMVQPEVTAHVVKNDPAEAHSTKTFVPFRMCVYVKWMLVCCSFHP